MILKSAIKAFLARPTDDHLWMKNLSVVEIDAALARLRPRPREQVFTVLRRHQKVCFLLGVAFPHFAFWNDMGTGKTLLSLELLRYWWDAGRLRRAIVFVKSDKAFLTWEKQAQLREFGLPLVALEDSSAAKLQTLSRMTEGVVLIPYPGAVALASKRVPHKTKKKRQSMVLDPVRVKQLQQWAQGMVLDESVSCGHTSSLTHMLARKLSKSTVCCYALAGRPFGRDPTMLWAQQIIVDGGETLGETLGLFRAAFFSEKASYWGGPYAKKYTFNKKLRPQLSKMMRHRSITYAADEVMELPRVNYVREEIKLPAELREYVVAQRAELKAARGRMREIQSAFIRSRQLSSGFLGMKDDETGERAQIVFDQNPKLDRLLELLEELPEGRGAVIFYEFTLSGRRIVEELRTRGHKPIWLWSGTKNVRGELLRFDKMEQPLAVINSKVGADSIDGLQHRANYEFFFESPVPVIDRQQAERRIIRDGQQRPVFIYDMIMNGTHDKRILEFHKEGLDLAQALLRVSE